MSISSAIKSWINKEKEEFDFIIITKRIELVKNISEVILKHKAFNENCKIVLSSKTSNKDFEELFEIAPNFIKYNYLAESQRIAYLLIDFDGTANIMGDQNFSYINNVEKSVHIRKKCKKIAMYNYTGQKINCGYWKLVDENESANVQFLNVCKWGKISQSIPFPRVKIQFEQQFSPDAIKWEKELKDFISMFVRKLCEDRFNSKEDLEEFVEQMTNNEAMALYTQAFQHKTQNAVYNNESLEFVGDNMLYSFFSLYLFKTFPRITQQEASGFQLQFLSAEYQYLLSDDLNLFDRLIKMNGLNPTKKAKTDVFEAFYGALCIVANNIDPGSFYMFVESFVFCFSESYPYNKDMIFGKSKQKVVQINEKLGFDKDSIKLIKKTEGQDKNISFYMYMVVEENLMDFYIQKDKKFDSKSSGKSTNPLASIPEKLIRYGPGIMTSSEAENELWNKVAECYDANGLTFDILNKKPDNIFRIIKTYESELYEKIIEKMEGEDNISRLKFLADKEEGYIILYKDPGDGSNIHKGFGELKSGQRLIDDYLVPYTGDIQDINLAVVPFPKEGMTFESSSKKKSSENKKIITPYDYGKLNALKQYFM